MRGLDRCLDASKASISKRQHFVTFAERESLSRKLLRQPEYNTGKKPIARIRLAPLANKAAPSSVPGQTLGQYKINIMESRKPSNSKTKNIKEHVYIPTPIKIFSSNPFEITIKTPSTTYLSKQTANVAQGSALPKKVLLPQSVLLKEIYHLAIFKKCDPLLNHLELKAIRKTPIASAKPMGLPIRV